MERISHKLGYHMKDATGKLAPVVKVSSKDFSRRGDPVGPMPAGGSSIGSGGMHVGGGNLPSAAEIIERERLGIDHVEGSDTNLRPTRGFGATYETFPDEITTSIDVTRLVHDLKRSGIEVSLIFSFLSFRFISSLWHSFFFSKYIPRWTQATTYVISSIIAPWLKSGVQQSLTRSDAIPRCYFCTARPSTSLSQRRK